MAKEKQRQYDPAAMLLGGSAKPDPEGQEPEKEQEKGTGKAPKAALKAATDKKKSTKKKTASKAEPKAKQEKTAERTPKAATTVYRQKRDKRLQVVLTQDLYDRLHAEKELTGAKSVNEIVNVLLEQGLKKRG